MGGGSYGPWSPTQGETYHVRPRFTGFEQLLCIHVPVETSKDPWPLSARAPRTTTVAAILYATPAWWGFAGEGDRIHLKRLIARMRRRGYLPDDFPKINL